MDADTEYTQAEIAELEELRAKQAKLVSEAEDIVRQLGLSTVGSPFEHRAMMFKNHNGRFSQEAPDSRKLRHRLYVLHRRHEPIQKRLIDIEGSAWSRSNCLCEPTREEYPEGYALKSIASGQRMPRITNSESRIRLWRMGSLCCTRSWMRRTAGGGTA